MTDLLLHLDVGDQTVPEMVWWYCRINVRHCIQLATGRVTYIIIAAVMTWIRLAQRTLMIILYWEVPMELFMKLHIKGKISFRRYYVKEKKKILCVLSRSMMWYKVPPLEIKCVMLCVPAGIHVTQQVKQTSTEDLQSYLTTWKKQAQKNITQKYQEMRAWSQDIIGNAYLFGRKWALNKINS